MQPIDLFATKGVEYLFAGAFLLALAGFWKLVNPRPVLAPAVRRLLPWFQLRDDAFFHQGHTWVVPAGHGEALVGMDDFAQKLLGTPGGFLFPAVGTRVTQGEPAWQVQVDGHAIPMLSPVGGEVLAVNEDVVRSPGLVNTEIGLKSNSFIARWLWDWRRRGGISPEETAKGIVYLATEPSIQNSPEVYWKHGRPKTPSAYALNPQAAKQLWELSAQMCGLGS